jgi:uncharacterized protein (TIGR00369 family)
MSDRTRTITWADPLEMAATIAELSGLERMRRVISGQLAAPPIAHLMNIRLVEADEGRVVFEGRPEEYHYNPIGMVHGGFAATILDSAMGCAVHTKLPARVAYTTLEVKVSFIRPVKTTTGVAEPWAPCSTPAGRRRWRKGTCGQPTVSSTPTRRLRVLSCADRVHCRLPIAD